LLRHAETSSPDRFHGAESDVGLGQRGRLQSAFLAQYLAELGPDAVYSSAMRRALETAGPIARACGLEVEVIEALHERKMGVLSGLEKGVGWERYAQEKDRWMSGDLDFAHDGAESYAEVRTRALPAIMDLAERSEGRTLVVVAHGVLIRIVLTSLLDDRGPEDFDRIGIDNGALNDLRWDGVRW
jgi:broad specificity phosphatase PhoE